MGGCGGLERTDLQQFLILEDVVVLKFNSTLGLCGCLERADF